MNLRFERSSPKFPRHFHARIPLRRLPNACLTAPLDPVMKDAAIDYLNLDLEIEPWEGAYRARVLASPAGEGSHVFTLPFSELEIDHFRLSVRHAPRTRRIDPAGVAAAKTVGGRLFENVFGGEVRACFRASLDAARRLGKSGVRVRLRLGGAPELGVLPWEYLYEAELNRFVATSTRSPVVRYLAIPEAVEPLRARPPLRVLAMVSSPEGVEPLEVEAEWKMLSDALAGPVERGLVVLERLETPTLDALRARLRRERFHVFHFIGHGGFDPRTDDGVLVMADARGHARPVPAEHVGTLLRDEETLRLVVVNACETARGSLRDPFSGTAQGLMQQGIPAVVAMQFEISDQAALTFAREFYAALADGYPVDAAVTEARKAILTSHNELEWGTPVLYMRAEDGRIFDLDAAVPAGPAPAERAPEPDSEEPSPPPESTHAPASPPRARRRPAALLGVGLLALAVAGGWLALSIGDRTVQTSPAAMSSPADAELLEVIDRASALSVSVWRSGRLEELSRFYADSALADVASQIRTGYADDLYHEDRLLARDSIRVERSGAGATVKTVEDWESVARRVDNGACLTRSRYPDMKVTRRLVYGPQGWKITSIRDSVPAIAEHPCDTRRAEGG